MSEKLERLKFKLRGQRGVVIKFRQEANSLLEVESSSLRHLKTIWGILREKQTGLKTMDEDKCPIDEVEKQIIEAD